VLIVDSATRDFVGMTGPTRGRMAYLPGLDGLRGLAVIGVLAFHAGFERMVGGYLGVSTFFTLSGFLITSLLLQEFRREGGVALRPFWTRRVRRLWPASLAVLAAVMLLFAPFIATADQRATMRGDVLSSLFEVANWHFIFQGKSYADLFVSPSPVLHFWSLAIEEQFYLVFPLLLIGLWRWCRGRHVWLGVALAGLAVCSMLEPVIFAMSDDRIYFGTDTRAAELLLGGVLAVVLASDRLRVRIIARPGIRRSVAVVGAAALALQLWWWWSLPQTTSWLYRGGFGLYALLSCAVITAAALPTGPTRWVLSLSALRWVGMRSFGIYVIHWPIFLAVRQTWPELDRWVSTAIAVGVTFGLAVVSYRYIERPVRMQRWPARGQGVGPAVLGVGLVAALAFLPLPVDASERAVDFEASLNDYQSFVSDGASRRPTPPSSTTVPPPTVLPATTVAGAPVSPPIAPPPPPTTLPPAPVPSVAWFGDSTALLAAMGYAVWGRDSGMSVAVEGSPVLGCGVSRFVSVKADVTSTPGEDCRAWPERWSQRLDAGRPDVAVLMSSVWELPDAMLPGATSYSSLGDPVVDDFVRSELLQAVDVLSSRGAMVALVTAPTFASWADDGRPDAVSRQLDPVRTDRLNQIFGEVAAQRPDTVRLIDLAARVAPQAEDPALRVDGVHIGIQPFNQVSAEWFGPELQRNWEAWWRSRR